MRVRCNECGGTIPLERRGPRTLYCSRRCSDQFKLRRRRLKRRLEAEGKLPEYLKGKEFAKWFRARYLLNPDRLRLEDVLGDAGTRLLFACENENRNPSVYTVDKLLIGVGGHLSEIPDDLWLYGQPRPHRYYTDQEKRRALHMLDEGMTWREVSDQMGCSIDILKKWQRQKVPA